MQFSVTIIATALALATGSAAWAQDQYGNWVANNNWACTGRGTGNIQFGVCEYWADGIGGKFKGST
ncbi:hypothetical protein PG984_013851 [Apiospora sp. TS-2023a]